MGNTGVPIKWACTVLVGACALMILLLLPGPSNAADEVITAVPGAMPPAIKPASPSLTSALLPTALRRSSRVPARAKRPALRSAV
jgi:hypothetical protein